MQLSEKGRNANHNGGVNNSEGAVSPMASVEQSGGKERGSL